MVSYELIKFIFILFVSGQGLICLFSFFSLVFVSHARKKFKEGIMREMIDNLVALAFVTYLFTFFNILFKEEFIIINKTIGEFLLNAFIVLILIVIIKTTVDIINNSKEQQGKKTKRKKK